ncbi:superinfection immunity protein [Larkinella harenae]
MFFYFLPALNAWQRKHRNQNAILLSNILFGWTILGWLICLIWSVTDNVRSIN